jgi:hypothetical protein
MGRIAASAPRQFLIYSLGHVGIQQRPCPRFDAWLLAIFPETVRQVVFAPRKHLRLDQGNGLSAGASEAVKPSAGHWGKMLTGRWAWLSEISPIADDQEAPRSIVPAICKYLS